MRNLLSVDPCRRMTIHKVSNHSWLRIQDVDGPHRRHYDSSKFTKSLAPNANKRYNSNRSDDGDDKGFSKYNRRTIWQFVKMNILDKNNDKNADKEQ